MYSKKNWLGWVVTTEDKSWKCLLNQPEEQFHGKPDYGARATPLVNMREVIAAEHEVAKT